MSTNNDCKTIVNHIYTRLLLNQLQRFVVEKILNYIIKFTTNPCEKRNNQLLLYVKKQNNVEKNRTIKILQIKFACFKKQHELIVIALIECAVDAIKIDTVHIALNINI